MEKEDDLIGDVMSYVHGMMDSGFKRNQSLDKYITDYDQVCTNTYWNECYSNDPVTADSQKSSPRRRFQRKMNEFEYWKTKLKKGCQSIKLSDDVKNMEEMYWMRTAMEVIWILYERHWLLLFLLIHRRLCSKI